MSARDPYRDELRAAQDRIALLEEKLAARAVDEDDDEEVDEELNRLDVERRALLWSRKTRVAGERSVLAGLITTAVASLAIMPITSAMLHPNLTRAAILALICGAVAAAFTFFLGIAGAQAGLTAVDVKIAAARRRVEEARRLRAIERELRVAREAREQPKKAPRARIAVEGAEDQAIEDEATEEARERRVAR